MGVIWGWSPKSLRSPLGGCSSASPGLCLTFTLLLARLSIHHGSLSFLCSFLFSSTQSQTVSLCSPTHPRTRHATALASPMLAIRACTSNTQLLWHLDSPDFSSFLDTSIKTKPEAPGISYQPGQAAGLLPPLGGISAAGSS